MLSYKNWKMLNENFNRSLGISSPQSLGIMSSMHTEVKDEAEPEETNTSADGEMVQPSSKKDEADGPKKCKKCGKYCGKMCKAMKKEEHDHDEDEHEEEEHEDHEEEEHEDHDEDEHEEEEHDDHEEEEEDEEDNEEEEEEDDEDDDYEEATKSCGCDSKEKKKMKCMKCMKESVAHKKMKKHSKKMGKYSKKMGKYSKKMKYLKAHEVEPKDINKNGKIDGWEKARANAIKKSIKKNESVNDDAWMNGVFGQKPDTKFFDGIS